MEIESIHVIFLILVSIFSDRFITKTCQCDIQSFFLEAVLTSTNNLCFWSKNKKKYTAYPSFAI